MIMKLELICSGLTELLVDNNYSSTTINFYQREWKKLNDFLLLEYGDDDFSIDKGLIFLEKIHGIVSSFEESKLKDQQMQLIRSIQILQDYKLHGVITKRYYASKNPIRLEGYYLNVHVHFIDYLDHTELSKSTKKHYIRISLIFLDYLNQKGITDVSYIDLSICNDYIRTFTGMSFKTIEQHICGLRYFLRYLNEENVLESDVASLIHMPAISKSTKIPSVWTEDEIKKLLQAIDRNSPIGKRDYAMIVLACILGLRISDIKNLKFDNFKWEEKKLSIIQHKTKKPLTLPIPDAVGWAVIDYIKNGRPKYYESKFIFLKHMPPFGSLSDENHLSDRIHFYMKKAKIPLNKNCHRGFHSLRHTSASMLLDAGVELPVITSILGHSSTDITSIYLKTDLDKLKECVLDLTFDDEYIDIR